MSNTTLDVTSISNSNITATICGRVRERINTSFTNAQCLQIAVIASMREYENVIGFMLSYLQIRLFNEHRESIKLTLLEWRCLFGNHVSPVRDGGLNHFVAGEGFEFERQSVESAIRLTILEQDQSVMWKKPWHQVVVFIALHLDFYEEAFVSSFGIVMKADQRRIDDLVNHMDEHGVESLVFYRGLELVTTILVS